MNIFIEFGHVQEQFQDVIKKADNPEHAAKLLAHLFMEVVRGTMDTQRALSRYGLLQMEDSDPIAELLGGLGLSEGEA